ncbi:transmembrane protein 45B-like [Paramacrobiotus metropolitanus]|uniref:transmembrane protein 45B-like n=1 Tax=Paramacrobiotus metropolitanus TaxID=2943436 RepID=UPI002445A809|nr:transmembrane protein 45B-like [Paramacrobiotus metropolitanus]
MGSFVGHVIPGGFFVIWAIWSACYIFHRYFTGLARNKNAVFTSSTRFTGIILKCLPLDAALKLLLPVIGIFGEAFGSHGIGPNNIQHMTMYTAFAVHAVSELLQSYRRSALPVTLPTAYLTLILAYTAEALLFMFHVHGRSMLDMQVHTLLVYAIWLCVVATIAEVAWPNSLLLPVTRAYGTLLQGVWFMVVAFILYNPQPGAVPWKGDDHGKMMLVTNIFIWVALGCFVLLSVICYLVKGVAGRVGSGRLRSAGIGNGSGAGDAASMELLTNDEWQ